MIQGLKKEHQREQKKNTPEYWTEHKKAQGRVQKEHARVQKEHARVQKAQARVQKEHARVQ